MDNSEHRETRSSRRTFCAQACQAASLAAVGALVGCGGNPASPSGGGGPAATLPTMTATQLGRDVSVVLDGSALGTVGSVAIAYTSTASYLLARTAQDAYTALSSACTHEECEVNGFSNGRFVCLCHGSQFTTSGAVATGPARRALSRYATQLSGNVLTFTV